MLEVCTRAHACRARVNACMSALRTHVMGAAAAAAAVPVLRARQVPASTARGRLLPSGSPEWEGTERRPAREVTPLLPDPRAVPAYAASPGEKGSRGPAFSSAYGTSAAGAAGYEGGQVGNGPLPLPLSLSLDRAPAAYAAPVEPPPRAKAPRPWLCYFILLSCTAGGCCGPSPRPPLPSPRLLALAATTPWAPGAVVSELVV
jgi:hypothetical protein